MRDAKCVPEDNIRVVNVLIGVLGDPVGETLRGLAGRLRDMAAGGVELVVLVWFQRSSR